MKWFLPLVVPAILAFAVVGCEAKPTVVIEDGDEEAITAYEEMLSEEGEGEGESIDAP